MVGDTARAEATRRHAQGFTTRGSRCSTAGSKVQIASASINVATTSAIASGRLRARWRDRRAAASSAIVVVTGTVSQPSTKSRAAASGAPPTVNGPPRSPRATWRQERGRHRPPRQELSPQNDDAGRQWRVRRIPALASRTISCTNPRERRLGTPADGPTQRGCRSQ
jgi:hypothetical protein